MTQNQTTSIGIAILRYPVGDLWAAYVVCQDGPTRLLSARPREQMIAASSAAVRDMATHAPGPVQVWRWETTETEAQALVRDLPTPVLVQRVRREAEAPLAAREFRAGQRVMETRSGRGWLGTVQRRIIGYPADVVPVELDGTDGEIVGIPPHELIIDTQEPQ
ncbi:hypothetical protein [Amycolatopsis taiwanensis]|uniref:hypothetical protein n=1 Tax=Amycolatopsis taiwanensis TaxID=342230 RepID=UPI000482CB6B|nr:hypothetical protein [Amycolatopsis taiwanensis]